MSNQLEQRIGDLGRERERLRSSIQRIGDTFAANLDRAALLQIGVQTAVDAVEATCGRALVAPGAGAVTGAAATERARVGEPTGAELATLRDAEARALATGVPASVTKGGSCALAAPIPRTPSTGREAFSADDTARDANPTPHGLVSVARDAGCPFTAEERALLASLAAQTGISLENVELHDRVTRQAVTDELTGLFNHRRFQEVVTAEIAASHRYDRPLGLLMIDIDNFKRVNDTYGHQQGDLVLREVARALRDTCREIDEPARYGGEEMAVALPQTDLDGAYAIAERARTAVEALRIPRLDGAEPLRVTVSCGVAATSGAATVPDKDALIAAADAALYRAKHSGKNRTVRAAGDALAPA
jgi:diguanylate cyclase (GGDEF)-like protein